MLLDEPMAGVSAEDVAGAGRGDRRRYRDGRPDGADGRAPHGRRPRPGRPDRRHAPRRAARLRHPGGRDGERPTVQRPTWGAAVTEYDRRLRCRVADLARPPRRVAHPAGRVLRRSPRRRRDRAARPQRRRQDHHARGHPRPRPAPAGRDPAAGRASCRPAAPTDRPRRLGYVPEDRDVFAGLTVEENLRLAERTGAGAATTWCTSSSRSSRRAAGSGPARCPAASSRWSRSPACC